MSFLGIDTSNYTTSAAVLRRDGSGCNEGRLLSVKSGELGLRQSEALFQHVKRLPERFALLEKNGWLVNLKAVGASTRPRSVEGSYMPCFLAGESQGRCLASTLGVPFYAFSHQEGHIAAACWSAGREELLDSPLLAWHLSGGTTELLLVRPRGVSVECEIIGGTSDLSAGQLIDRTGQRLGLDFPAGKAIDALARRSQSKDLFRVKLQGKRFSLSGVENQVLRRMEEGKSPEDVAAFVLGTLADLLRRAVEQARGEYPGLPVLFSGGVSSNCVLRERLRDAVFCQPQFSTDNAMGIALLTRRTWEEAAR